jgi:hypothetical protein
MKKLNLFYYLLFPLIALIGCDRSPYSPSGGGGNGSTQTPEEDLTKLWPAVSGNLWGYINAEGDIAISPMFDYAYGFSCGYAQVEMDGDEKFIDKKGNWQATPSYDYADAFCYNYSTIRLDGSYGLMNNKFEITVQPYFAGLGTMGDNGLVAAVREGSNKAEYINAKGETKIAAMYDGAEQFLDGVAVVTMGSKQGAINKAGEFTIQPTYEYGLWNMSEGLLCYVDNNEKCGILDKNGNIVVSPIYYDLGNVSDGLIQTVGKVKCGYMNKKGEIVIPEIYYSTYPFYEGQAWVKQSEEEDGAWISIDKKNSVIFYLAKGEYPVTGFHNGLALVETEDGYKYVNKSGSLVYSWTYDYDEWYAPKKAQREQMSFRERMEEFNNMTLRFDSRKL